MSAKGIVARPALRVLLVCTANVSRSPLAAALLTKRLGDAGVAATVRSAGVIHTRLPVDELAVAVGRELGVEIGGHAPRRVTASAIAEDGTDLVIGLARSHVREVVALDASAWDRSFTLKELARVVGREQLAVATDPAGWQQRFGSGRSAYDLLGEDERDDIADPYRRSLATHRAVATEIDRLLATVVDGFLGIVGAD
ncbi:MAG: low molecular weight phosphatase family protein [Acidimicrobiia bacterium]